MREQDDPVKFGLAPDAVDGSKLRSRGPDRRTEKSGPFFFHRRTPAFYFLVMKIAHRRMSDLPVEIFQGVSQGMPDHGVLRINAAAAAFGHPFTQLAVLAGREQERLVENPDRMEHVAECEKIGGRSKTAIFNKLLLFKITLIQNFHRPRSLRIFKKSLDLSSNKT